MKERNSRKQAEERSQGGEAKIPEGFTLSMALMDMLPVIFFSCAIWVLTGRLASRLFLSGAVLVILAGAMKVLWKLVLAVGKRDVRILNRQLRYLMPAGFLLMIAGLIADRDAWSMQAVVSHVLSIPAGIFFILAAAGIACMVYFAGHLDGRDAKSSWVEQGTNALAQLFFLLGILF